MTSFLKTYANVDYNLQAPADVAVVIPTVLRPSLADALRSVFAQDLRGRIQILVGVDVTRGDPALVEQVCSERPPNVAVQIVYPGYSTSTRHGGLSPAGDGGTLRTVLSFLANSVHIAYLDDDNWWAPGHLSSLLKAVAGLDWAFALRWYVHPETRRPICIDEWESLGPGDGAFAGRFGGFVDPSCLLLNKLRCAAVLPLWRLPSADDERGQTADRTVFAALRNGYLWRGSGEATTFYTLDPRDGNHRVRMEWAGWRYQAAGRQASSESDGETNPALSGLRKSPSLSSVGERSTKREDEA